MSNKNKSNRLASKRVEKKSIKFGKLQLLLNIVAVITFISIGYYVLAISNSNFLIKLQELSLFIPTDYFLNNNLELPGGLLTWLGTFFTQFFYYPWLGASIFIVLALLLQFVVVKSLKISKKYFLFSLILPFAILVSVTQMGYMIYTLKAPGFSFSNLLGFISVALLFWLYRNRQNIWTKLGLFAAVTFFLYPLLGFYAILALTLFICYELVSFFEDRQKSRILVIIVGLLLGILVPYLMYIYIYPQLSAETIYTSILPNIYTKNAERILWLPYLIIIAFMIIASLLSKIKFKKEVNSISIFFGVAVFALTLYVFGELNYKDENFSTEIAMDLAVFDNRWEDVIELAKNQKDEPTRWIVMNRNLALQKLGRAGDEMFKFKNGDKHSNAPWPTRLLVLAGRPMFYHYGKTNYCYHWSMEPMVERGMKVEYLKYMIKCALIKSEYKLAQKYNNILKLTMFHKTWAEKYQKFIDNPRSMLEDSEFVAIKPFTAYDDELLGNNGILEVELVKYFAYTESVSEEILDVAIQSTLLMRESKLFWPRFFLYLKLNKGDIPIHYQEAALMYAYFEKKVNIENIQFDSFVVDRFSSFIKMTNANYNKTKDVNMKLFKSAFGDTYWYYYFFTKKITTL